MSEKKLHRFPKGRQAGIAACLPFLIANKETVFFSIYIHPGTAARSQDCMQCTLLSISLSKLLFDAVKIISCDGLEGEVQNIAALRRDFALCIRCQILALQHVDRSLDGRFCLAFRTLVNSHSHLAALEFPCRLP